MGKFSFDVQQMLCGYHCENSGCVLFLCVIELAKGSFCWQSAFSVRK
jgi:hypothetical protein